MPQLNKRPLVIQDLIEISTYISYDNLDASDNDPEIQSASIELKSLLLELQTKNPAIATTEEAIAIIDVEFTEIKQTNDRKLAKLPQFLLDPKRHIKAIKATVAEVAKHYLEESVWAKAIITYGDTLID